MKKRKRIIAMMLSLALLMSSNSNMIAYAIDNTKSIEQGQKYKKSKKVSVQKSSLGVLDNGKELGQEAIDDLNNLGNIEYLQKITDKKYEIALLHNNGEYTYLDSAQTLEDAKKIANSKSNQKSLESNAVPVVIDENGLVVYATGNTIAKIVKLKDGKPVNATIDIYKNATTTSKYTYINHAYLDDAPIIAESGNRVKVQINGLTGWIDKSDSEGTNVIVVPASNSLNLSYYKKTSSGALQHYISTDVQTSNSGHSRNIGVAPSFMSVDKKYYSYDGIYFYTNIDTLITDLKNGTNNNAVNKSNPYYNYYLYLPGRSKTSYYSKEIDKYIENNTPSDSVLRGEGINLVKAQNKYGVNASFILGVAMNESAKGTSNLAKTKNNIFGITAYDTDVGAATTFNSISGCIDTFAKEYMSNQYFNPKSWKYSGSNLGNKGVGANVWYASDPFWGEKAASYMYEMDKYISGSSSLIEYNKYQLALYNGTNKVKNSSGSTLYEILKTRSTNTGQVGDPVILLDQQSSNYTIYPDRNYPISVNPPVAGEYNWSMLGYISTTGIKKINTKNSSSRPITNSKPVINASNKELKVGDSFNPKTGVTASDNEDGDLTSRIMIKTNTVNTKTEGSYKVVYEVMDSDLNTTTKEITVKVGNSKPVITASDKTIKIGDSFDPKNGVTANDKEDGNITSKIVVKENTVNTKVLGTYKVVYEVTDTYGNVVTKEIKVTVGKALASFTVNNINNKSTLITGNGVSGATVKAYVGTKQIGSTVTVNSAGKYSITIPAQSAKTKVTVKMTKNGYAPAEKSITVIAITNKYNKTLTKDIYKYDIGKSNYLTYINGKGYSQFSYLNKSGNYAFIPSSWMSAAGLDVSMPTSTNGYTMTIDNNYIQMYNEANELLKKVQAGQISKANITRELKEIENMKTQEIDVQNETILTAKSKPNKVLTKDIYKYDAGSGKYLTYINGKGYSQYSYLNASGNYAFTPSSWLKAAGLTVTMPNSSNGYTMKVTNSYVNKYNDVVKQIESYI